MKSCQTQQRNYKELKTLYHNSQSKITLVKAQNGTLYIRKDVYDKVFWENPYFNAYFQTEKIIMSLHGDYLVCMYDQWKENNYYSIIMENCDLGDLKQYIQTKYNNKVPHQIIPQIFAQVLCGLGQIHKYNIVHRDLKPENIFLKNQDGQIKVKLGDFGTSKIVIDLTSTHLGTKGYMAPQLYQNKPYSSKIDIWSLGIVLFKLYNQMKEPFSRYKNGLLVTEKQQEYYSRIKNSKIKGPIFRIPQQFQDNKMIHLAKKMVNKMLRYDPEQRIDWLGILKSPYMKQFKNQSIKLQKNSKLISKLFQVQECYQRHKKKAKLIQVQNRIISMLLDQIFKPMEQLFQSVKQDPNICELLLLEYLGIRRILLILCQSKEDRIELGIYTTQEYCKELKLIQWKEDLKFKLQLSYLKIKKTLFAIQNQQLQNKYYMKLLEDCKGFLKQYKSKESQQIIIAIQRYLRIQLRQSLQSTVILDTNMFEN